MGWLLIFSLFHIANFIIKMGHSLYYVHSRIHRKAVLASDLKLDIHPPLISPKCWVDTCCRSFPKLLGMSQTFVCIFNSSCEIDSPYSIWIRVDSLCQNHFPKRLQQEDVSSPQIPSANLPELLLTCFSIHADMVTQARAGFSTSTSNFVLGRIRWQLLHNAEGSSESAPGNLLYCWLQEKQTTGLRCNIRVTNLIHTSMACTLVSVCKAWMSTERMLSCLQMSVWSLLSLQMLMDIRGRANRHGPTQILVQSVSVSYKLFF